MRNEASLAVKLSKIIGLIAKAIKEALKAAGHYVFFVCAISAQMFVKSEYSPLDIYLLSGDQFKIQTSLHSLAVFKQSCCVRSLSNCF